MSIELHDDSTPEPRKPGGLWRSLVFGFLVAAALALAGHVAIIEINYVNWLSDIGESQGFSVVPAGESSKDHEKRWINFRYPRMTFKDLQRDLKVVIMEDVTYNLRRLDAVTKRMEGGALHAESAWVRSDFYQRLPQIQAELPETLTAGLLELADPGVHEMAFRNVAIRPRAGEGERLAEGKLVLAATGGRNWGTFALTRRSAGLEVRVYQPDLGEFLGKEMDAALSNFAELKPLGFRFMTMFSRSTGFEDFTAPAEVRDGALILTGPLEIVDKTWTMVIEPGAKVWLDGRYELEMTFIGGEELSGELLQQVEGGVRNLVDSADPGEIAEGMLRDQWRAGRWTVRWAVKGNLEGKVAPTVQRLSLEDAPTGR